VVPPSIEATVEAADRVTAAIEGARAIADFGPVLDARGQPVPDEVGRLEGAADLPGFPEGRPLATDAFAMEAIVSGVARRFPEIGRTSTQEAARSGPRAAAATGVFLIAGKLSAGAADAAS
jgi:hypothetical protein